jgi:hypothetical protein
MLRPNKNQIALVGNLVEIDYFVVIESSEDCHFMVDLRTTLLECNIGLEPIPES